MTETSDPQGVDYSIDHAGASVRRQVEGKLRRAIIEGHFAPGDHLSDRKLTQMFNVSRSVVREAVRQLEAEGLVETAPHRGSFVKIMTVEEAVQIYDVRGVLEALAARCFARNASDKEVAALDDVFQRLRAISEGRDTGTVIDLKQEFYAIMNAGARNAYVRDMLNQILNRNTQLRATTLSDPTRLPQTVAELSELMTAIHRRDEDAAWEASLHHVQMAAEKALSILKANEAARTE